MRSRRSLLTLAFLSLLVLVSACGDKGADKSGENATGSGNDFSYKSDPDPFPALALTPEQTVCPPELCALHEPPIYIVRQVGNDLLIGGGRDDIIRVRADGKPAGKIGKHGKGPGDYTTPMAADFDDQGNLVIVDLGNGFHVVRMDAEGKALSPIRIQPPKSPEMPLGFVLNGGKVYMLSGHAGAPTDSQNFTLNLVSDDGRTLTPVAHAHTALPFDPNSAALLPRLFQPYPLVAIHRSGNIYLADGSAYQIRKLDAAGKPARVISVDVKPLLVTPADVNAQAQNPDAVRDVPNVFPVLASMRVLNDETLWIRRYTKATTDSARWDSFTSDGKPLGTVTLSNVADIRAGTADRILVVDKDSLNYPLIRWMSVKRK